VTRVALLLPLLVAAGFGLCAPLVARRLPPRQATWLLSAGATLTALCGLAVLGLVGSVLVGQEPSIAREGHWSGAALRARAPVDAAVAAVALTACAAAVAAGLHAAVRRGRSLLALHRLCRELPAAGSGLVVVDDPAAGAYAVPGRPGRVVVSQSLLAALSAPERRALLAHECAHLRRGHHWHLAAVTLAAAVNPLLRPARLAAAHAVERWADEEAAAAVGDRRVAATALARAALLTGGRPPTLAAAAHAVPLRVAALLAAPPRSRPRLATAVVLLLLVGAGAAVLAAARTEDLFDLARAAATR
jgi:Zn-dependent protease with chaperone function